MTISAKKEGRVVYPLPNVRLHFLCFLGGIAGLVVVGSLHDSFPKWFPVGLALVFGLPCWLAVVIPLIGYSTVYPFLHLSDRYNGCSQQQWLIWLVIDTVGITLGLVRISYYLSVIIPDFLEQRAMRKR